MNTHDLTVVGIDVGAERKGFHAVVLRNGRFLEKPEQFAGSSAVVDCVDWCLLHAAHVVAVDAPCKWSQAGSSRCAERTLSIGERTIQCFKTPTRERALANQRTKPKGKRFYDWVFDGEKLYQGLKEHYSLFDGTRQEGRVVVETFPHAVVCALAGKVIAAKHKATIRRDALRRRGYDVSGLRNVDFVDAALCALTAGDFLQNYFQQFGDIQEGFIVVPDLTKWALSGAPQTDR